MVRFLYYGLMLRRSPHFQRKAFLFKYSRYLLNDKELRNFNPSEYEIQRGELLLSLKERDEFEGNMSRLFPWFLNQEPLFYSRAKQSQHPVSITDDDSAAAATIQKTFVTEFMVNTGVSRWQKIAAWFQDIDYYAPIWFNLIAIGAWFYSLGYMKEFSVGLAAFAIARITIKHGGLLLYRWRENDWS